ncbi:glycosyl transferase [Corynebacterium phocae]|uniref:Glycosyl transferase n=1 Tax=Corynebacterium phocae TaxID=161895 RepID=A0A1L7D620_9CORY|nr:glycosyltransferase family 4 protein [Corynebacterium phocae]APT93382.1 glycosyl transferase [Corynebacterium phocae]KAA8721724.1 glycosyltransferase family 4 protein [Corynebacterium phocae]
MKILLLCWRDTTHPQGGGSERYLEHVASYLAAQGHEVVFRTAKHMNGARRERRNGVKFERGGGKFTVYPLGLLATLRHKPDVVVDTQNGIPFFARLVARCPVVLLTHHCHQAQWPVAGPVLSRVGWFLESKLAPRVYRGARYVTVSEASAQDLRHLGVEGVEIIENGVDPIPQHVPRLEREADIHLVTLSRLVPHKQIEHAMDTVAQIPGSVLDVIGSGWWEANLREYAHAHGVESRVRFRGQVTEDYKHALLERADIHLMPSRMEGWGLAVMEAAQHAVPTVGYSYGLRDSVRHGETGLLAQDVAGLVAATTRLIEDPELRRRLGAGAREFAQNFSWQRTGERFERLLSAAVPGGRQQPPPVARG